MGFIDFFLVSTIGTEVEMIQQQKYKVKDEVTHGYIVIIVIIRADTKRFNNAKVDIKSIKGKKSCQRSLWFLTLNTTLFQLVKIGAKNFGTGFRNTYFDWFGWFLAGLL